MARSEQMIRQWQMLQRLIATRNGLSATALSKDLRCHKRTVYRDLNALQQAGFPLYNPDEESDGSKWAILDTGSKTSMLFPLELSELMALYLGRNVLKIMTGTFIYDNLDSFFKKIKALLPPESIDFLKKLEDTLHVKQRPHKDYKKDLSSVFHILNNAISQNRTIEITYFTISRGKKNKRQVNPYNLYYFDGSIYLIAFCRVRQEIRIFAVDRILDCQTTGKSFEKPYDYSSYEFMQNSFGVFQGCSTHVKIRFSNQVAEYIKEKIWHVSQSINENRDGSIFFEADVAGTREIKSWVLGWGAQAEVLEPASLREELRTEMNTILARYS